MIGIGLFDVFLHPTAEPDKSMCITLGSDQNSEFYRDANFFENVKFDEKTCFPTKKLKFMIEIGLYDVFLHQTVEPDKSMCLTLGSDRNSDFYRGANFFENVKFVEKTCFSTKNSNSSSESAFTAFSGIRRRSLTNPCAYVGIRSKVSVLPRCKLF